MKVCWTCRWCGSMCWLMLFTNFYVWGLSFILIFEIYAIFWSGRNFEWRDSVGEVSGVESVGGWSAKHARHLGLLQDDWNHDWRNYMYVISLRTSEMNSIMNNMVSFFHVVIKCCMWHGLSPFSSNRQHLSYDEIIRTVLCCIVYWSCAQL